MNFLLFEKKLTFKRFSEKANMRGKSGCFLQPQFSGRSNTLMIERSPKTQGLNFWTKLIANVFLMKKVLLSETCPIRFCRKFGFPKNFWQYLIEIFQRKNLLARELVRSSNNAERTQFISFVFSWKISKIGKQLMTKTTFVSPRKA